MKRIFIITAALLLALLFGYAAYNKLIIYNTFISQLKASPILGGYENIFSWLVPAIEIIIAGLLIFNRTRLTGLYSAFFLMLLFTVYVYVLPHLFKNAGCSCGGIISHFTWQQHFWFNAGFTLLAGAAIVFFPLQKKHPLMV